MIAGNGRALPLPPGDERRTGRSGKPDTGKGPSDSHWTGPDLVGDTRIELVTSSVSRKRSPTELIARGGGGNRTRVQGFAGPCLSHSATPPNSLEAETRGPARDPSTLRADDGTRTRDPHLGKVMRYQLRYVRMFPACLPWRDVVAEAYPTRYGRFKPPPD